MSKIASRAPSALKRPGTTRVRRHAAYGRRPMKALQVVLLKSRRLHPH